MFLNPYKLIYYRYSSIILARVDRIKEAKVEAEQAIAAYKSEQEAIYQAALAKVERYVII